jgi:hypothetical protein
MLQLCLSFVLPCSTSSRQQQKIVCARAVSEHCRKRASCLKCFYNVTGKRNAQASEMRTFAKTTPLSTTPYNVATT